MRGSHPFFSHLVQLIAKPIVCTILFYVVARRKVVNAIVAVNLAETCLSGVEIRRRPRQLRLSFRQRFYRIHEQPDRYLHQWRLALVYFLTLSALSSACVYSPSCRGQGTRTELLTPTEQLLNASVRLVSMNRFQQSFHAGGR